MVIVIRAVITSFILFLLGSAYLVFTVKSRKHGSQEYAESYIHEYCKAIDKGFKKECWILLCYYWIAVSLIQAISTIN